MPLLDDVKTQGKVTGPSFLYVAKNGMMPKFASQKMNKMVQKRIMRKWTSQEMNKVYQNAQ